MRPDFDGDRRVRTIRLHVLTSPLENRFLSSHLRVSKAVVPARTPIGVLPANNPFLASYHLTADYCRTNPAWEDEMVQVARDYGTVLQAALTAKFELSPRQHGSSSS